LRSIRDILLVEDNPSDIDLTRRALAKGHIANDLVIADDGQKALDYLFGKGKYTGRDTSTLPALVLLDLKLPKVSGMEVLRQIRADDGIKLLPVVILTTSAEQRDIAAGYNLCVNSYIRKPVDFNQFVECVKQLGLYWLVLNEPPYPREEVL
jgi:CheY-like chemotaxis protein